MLRNFLSTPESTLIMNVFLVENTNLLMSLREREHMNLANGGEKCALTKQTRRVSPTLLYLRSPQNIDIHLVMDENWDFSMNYP